MRATSATAGGYSALYGLVAGLGDESQTEVARLVYLFLPALGLLFLIAACIPVVELLGALASARSKPGLNARRPTALPLGASLLLAGVLLGAWTILAVSGWTRPTVAVVGNRVGEAAPIARVRCEDGDTFLLTPNVVRHEDGVHVRVENRTDGELWLEYEIEGGAGGGGADLIAPGLSERLISIRGRSIGVVCSEEGDGTESRHAAMTVVGP
jgi:hypothetical protein